MKGEHTLIFEGYTITYWQRASACGHLDKWQSAVFEVRSGAYSTKFDVDGQYELDQIKRMLDRMFQKGRDAAKQEIREVLGVKQ